MRKGEVAEGESGRGPHYGTHPAWSVLRNRGERSAQKDLLFAAAAVFPWFWCRLCFTPHQHKVYTHAMLSRLSIRSARSLGLGMSS